MTVDKLRRRCITTQLFARSAWSHIPYGSLCGSASHAIQHNNHEFSLFVVQQNNHAWKCRGPGCLPSLRLMFPDGLRSMSSMRDEHCPKLAPNCQSDHAIRGAPRETGRIDQWEQSSAMRGL